MHSGYSIIVIMSVSKLAIRLTSQSVKIGCPNLNMVLMRRFICTSKKKLVQIIPIAEDGCVTK